MDAAGWDEVAEAYHGHIVSPYAPDAPGIHATLATTLVAAAALTPAGRASRPLRVLDAGCGPGNLLGLWAEHLRALPCELLVGLDFAGRALARARARAAGLPFVPVRADLGALPLAGRFDLVVSVNACLPPPHTKRRRDPVTRQLAELARALAPGGRLVAVLPSFDAELAEALRVLGGDPADGPGYAYARRQALHARRMDEASATMASGWGDLVCLHTPTTIAAELAAAGLTVTGTPARLEYPAATLDRLGYEPGARVWDWLVVATATPAPSTSRPGTAAGGTRAPVGPQLAGTTPGR